MKINRRKSVITGGPDYYAISIGHWNRYEKTGDIRAKSLAMHYARVAEDMGQAFIEEDTTQEITNESR